MSGLSPASVLFSSDGYELAVVTATSIPAGTRGLLVEGSDGTNSRFITVDTSGRQVIVGPGVAGTQSGGILTIQGDPSGTAVPISGTVTANAGTGNFTVVQATASNLNATIVGTTAAGSGASTGLVTIQGNASGTPVPISGTVTATNPSVGTDGSAALASDTQVGGKVTTAAPTYTTGNLNALSLTTLGGLRIDGVYASGTANATAADLGAMGGYVTTSAPTYTTGQLNALSLDTAGNLRTTAVVNKASTSAVTSVAGATSSTSVLASNSSRIFAAIYNNTNKNMYVLLGGGTASTSNFTTILFAATYWEVPVDYTGAINAIWASGVSGSVLVTELTP